VRAAALGWPTLEVGKPALWDSRAGLIPCKVLSIKSRGLPKTSVPSSEHLVEVELTADQGRFRKGERATDWSIYVMPPEAVREHRMCQPYLVVPCTSSS